MTIQPFCAASPVHYASPIGQNGPDLYVESAELLAAHWPGVSFDTMSREDVEAFLDDYLSKRKASSALVRFRALQVFFGWMEREEFIEVSPMAKLRPPSVAEQPVPILTEDELQRLLKVTGGKSFEDRRDRAMLMVLIDCGLRVGELVGLKVDDVDLAVHDVVHVMGKGGRGRAVPFGHATGQALDRYIRERRRHKLASQPATRDSLWLGNRGKAMTESGVAQMLRRRGAQADVANLRPHRFRHSTAHLLRVNGMDDDSLMRIMGWRSPQMLHRYGSSAGDQRASEAHRKFSPGDRL